MVKQFLISFAVVALSVASAETFRISLIEPAVVKGQALKAGDYKLDVQKDSVIMSQGKQKVEVNAKVENSEKKFHQTRILYNENKGKYTIQEIEIGGTNTKLLFDNGVQTGGGK
jgi:hypothetical protein